MRIGVDMRIPDVRVPRIVEQIVNQHVAVIVVHRAVGEHVAFEPGQHRVARRSVDDHRIADIAHCGVDQAEVEHDRVDSAEPVKTIAAGQCREAVVPRSACGRLQLADLSLDAEPAPVTERAALIGPDGDKPPLGSPTIAGVVWSSEVWVLTRNSVPMVAPAASNACALMLAAPALKSLQVMTKPPSANAVILASA